MPDLSFPAVLHKAAGREFYWQAHSAPDQPTEAWLRSIAIEMGYYDYQHMARDFREFPTLMPIEFFRAETDAPKRAFGNAET